MRPMTRRTRSGTRHSAGIPPETLAALAGEIGQEALRPITEKAAHNAAQDGTTGNYAAAVGGDNAAPAGKSPETIRQEVRQEIEAEQALKDVERLTGENDFLRQQLAQAVAGWRDEQRRVKELEQRLKELPAPQSEAAGSEKPQEIAAEARAGAVPQAQEPAPGDTERRATGVSGDPAPLGSAEGDPSGDLARPATEAPGGREQPAQGWWARLWNRGEE